MNWTESQKNQGRTRVMGGAGETGEGSPHGAGRPEAYILPIFILLQSPYLLPLWEVLLFRFSAKIILNQSF